MPSQVFKVEDDSVEAKARAKKKAQEYAGILSTEETKAPLASPPTLAPVTSCSTKGAPSKGSVEDVTMLELAAAAEVPKKETATPAKPQGSSSALVLAMPDDSKDVTPSSATAVIPTEGNSLVVPSPPDPKRTTSSNAIVSSECATTPQKTSSDDATVSKTKSTKKRASTILHTPDPPKKPRPEGCGGKTQRAESCIICERPRTKDQRGSACPTCLNRMRAHNTRSIQAVLSNSNLHEEIKGESLKEKPFRVTQPEEMQKTLAKLEKLSSVLDGLKNQMAG